jgi:asparagine synthase (glutamine-hydrolysing)
MCGIAGLIDFGGLARDAVAPRLDRALARLRPRGPDGEGNWFDARAALGHRRLAVVDLSAAGAQPMLRDGRALVFNGMIYNFRALRDELRGAGYRFTSETDTEVLLAGWAAWGAALLPRLIGMFAFALWDPARGELVLARDRFGKKPLLYRHDGRRTAFASQLHALHCLTDTASIDPAALRLYVALRYLPEPWSIVAGVAKLPPGHLARVTPDGVAVERWYDLATARPPRIADEAAAKIELRERFDAAVRDRLVADVPVGAFLSGGIDSALVAASMVRAAPAVRTFTVGFAGAASYYEERPAARAVARHLGADHTEIELSAEETERVLDAVFDGLDEPFADSSAVPTWLVARETRKHVTVALSGDGADEVFGGYRKYQGELLAERYRALPAPLRGIFERAIACLPEGKGNAALEAVRRARRFAAHAGRDAAGRQAGWAQSLSEAELDELLAARAPAPTVESLVAVLRAAAHDDDPINAMLAADIALVLPGDMLVKADRMTMAHGLELRCPFLDHRVVEWAAALPGHLKVARGAGKRILRDTFADRLPAEVFQRPKRGFEIPIAEWLTGPLADRVRRAIDPVRLKAEGLFRPELPQRWYDELKSGRRDTSWQLWTLVAFQAWQERQGA